MSKLTKSHGRKSISATLKPRDLMGETPRLKGAWMAKIVTLLRSIRLKDSFENFLSPEQEALKLAKFLAPTPVSMSYLEDWADHPEGSAGAILEFLEVPHVCWATGQPKG